jgi:GNAT superfamily N-acetyltransferase
MVREWDPRTASAAEIESMLHTLNAIITIDMPADPPWELDGLRDYFAQTMPGERRVCWIAEDPDTGGGPVLLGQANMLLLGDLGVVDLQVHPTARGRGVGHALLGATVRRAYDEGFASIGIEVVGDTPAPAFYENRGFRCAYVEMRSVLDLSNVDWLKLGEMAGELPDGYQVEYHAGSLPKETLDGYAAAKAARRGAEIGDLELRPSSYDAHRLADSLDTLNRRGMKPHIVLAIHSETGEVAGLTEVVAPTQHPTRADQYDTIVVPKHSGIGLERALKARMLFELRSAEPRLTEVQTWNALENDPMALVNAELGFQPDREWREYEADVLDLKQRLDHS